MFKDEEMYVCKASVRYLKSVTGKWESKCIKALIENKGDLILSANHLKPNSAKRPYHDYYYLGEKKKVKDPNKDLPRLITEPSTGALEEVAKEGLFDGERYVAPFGDANRFDEIEGSIFANSYFPVWENWHIQQVTIQGALMEITDRVRDKLKRKPKEELVKYYINAIVKLQKSKDAYFDGDFYTGNKLLYEARNWLVAAQDVKKARKIIDD